MGNDQSRSSDGGGLVDGMCCTKRKAVRTLGFQAIFDAHRAVLEESLQLGALSLSHFDRRSNVHPV